MPSALEHGVADEIVAAARGESTVWARSLRPEPEWEPVFSPLVPPALGVGLETVYEAYLAHYGTPRLFAPPDAHEAVLLGDYLYAHGLVRIAQLRETAAVADLAELISLCGQLRAEGREGDGAAWAASAALLGAGALDAARGALRDGGDPTALEALARESAGDDAVDRALAAHAGRVR
jgi:hypothetical protein